jgi:hypothetical protein
MSSKEIAAYPSEALALEVASDLGDVVLNHLSELSLVGDSLDPGRELRVPDKSVATEQLAVLGSESSGLVGSVKSELAAGGLKGIPLHAVLGGDLTEIGVDDLGSLGRAESARVGAGTEVTLALGGEKSIKALGVGGLASRLARGAAGGGVGRRSLSRDASRKSRGGSRDAGGNGLDSSGRGRCAIDVDDGAVGGGGSSGGSNTDASAGDTSANRSSSSSDGSGASRVGWRGNGRRDLSRGCNAGSGGGGSTSSRSIATPTTIATPSTTVTPRASPLRLGSRSGDRAASDGGGQSEKVGTHVV